MGEQDRYIPGVPSWVDTTQPDPESAVAFYADLFGWELENSMPPGAPGQYFMAKLGGEDVAAVSSPMGEAPPIATWNTYVTVEDADATAGKVRDAGGRVIMEPFDVMDSGRMGVFADPDGAVICVWQAKDFRGAGRVNEHGSLNFNVLNTRDLDGAARFYNAIFGWELVDIGGAPMWALPAYGELLERRTPGQREAMKEMGAPERFQEVVAAAAPIAGDQGEVPPHWAVTFAVDDADAIAERAAELGARVLVPPMDAPWTRLTVIADPQGATFTASKFVPENKDLPQGADAAARA